MDCRGCGIHYDELICISLDDGVVDKDTKEPIDKACIHCIERAKNSPVVTSVTTPSAA